MKNSTLIALAEPKRLRIVELLRERPRSVGEISSLLNVSQPQATKHLQVLEKAGLALMYPQGQRRIYILQAAPLKELRGWVDGFEPNWINPPHVPTEYIEAIKREQALAAKDSHWADGRSATITRPIAASRETLWRYWTEATELVKWFSPDYLTTPYAESDARPGGKLRVDMQDPDGTVHTAAGHYIKLQEPDQLEFMLSPLDPKGRPLFESYDTVTFKEINDETTELAINVRLAASTKDAATFIAGLELGWGQTLDKLERVLKSAAGSETTM